MTGRSPHSSAVQHSSAVAQSDDAFGEETDGRRLRRALNREAVVDALLSLYDEGNLRPGTDRIAERAGISPRSLFRYFDDTDDLAREAIARQQARAMPLLLLGIEADAPFDDRVRALVEQRFRLFDGIGQAAYVARLRAPFQPAVAESLETTRAFLRNQIRVLFATEFAALGDQAGDALAAADVVTSLESGQLLIADQGLSREQAKSVITRALSVLLSPGGSR